MAKKAKTDIINDTSTFENNVETSIINLEDISTTNVGMKTPDPSTHSNIAQIEDTFNTRELFKVKVHLETSPETPKEIAQRIADARKDQSFLNLV